MAMSFDPRSPSDRADMEPEYALTCPYCDEISDDGEICGSCAIDRAEFRYGRRVCVEA